MNIKILFFFQESLYRFNFIDFFNLLYSFYITNLTDYLENKYIRGVYLYYIFLNFFNILNNFVKYYYVIFYLNGNLFKYCNNNFDNLQINKLFHYTMMNITKLTYLIIIYKVLNPYYRVILCCNLLIITI